ncbi:hypothetical protein HH308_11150 [Gordonia sp. TBRC 11910]|uniref:PucR C-terminal helix-turn-helix domain-containing protein n=1 Tax=Gordonia asplenii TaxID=2725283 RepID=A0A848KTG2_9ACTN|nr:hypothetical protein [Gordonia asplenii]NMO01770.1 hypothetical protein [Gordonia asplenii]
MKEFALELSRRDPLMSEYLRIVSYFDALMADGAGLDVLLRGAAILSGTVVGAERRSTTVRIDPDGHHVVGDDEGPRSAAAEVGDGSVWLERRGDPPATDDMIIDRLAVAVGLLDTRFSSPHALSTAIDSAQSSSVRSTALIRLGVDPSVRIRLIATDAGTTSPEARSTLVPTRYGILRANLDTRRQVPTVQPAGIGRWMRADHAPESWEEAVIAYRLTNSYAPIVDATDFGAMLTLVKNFDPDAPHPDVVALARLDDKSAQILGVLAASGSVRAAAAELRIHHSTLQVKHDQLIRELGYDPRSVPGRMRYIAAEALRRLLPTASDSSNDR